MQFNHQCRELDFRVSWLISVQALISPTAYTSLCAMFGHWTGWIQTTVANTFSDLILQHQHVSYFSVCLVSMICLSFTYLLYLLWFRFH